MKKTIVTSICSLAVAGAAFAQGTVNWNSINPTQAVGVTNATVVSPFTPTGTLLPQYTTSGLTATTANGFYYELLYNTAGSQQSAPSTSTALNTWLDTSLEAVDGTSGAGRLLNVNGSTVATVPWANGTSDSIVLVGWSSNLGSSWSAAEALIENWTTADQTEYGLSFAGVSTTGYISPNVSPNTGATLFGTGANANGIPIYNPSSNPIQLDELVVSTPEPGTLALAALGGASLLLFRRKK